MKRFILAALAVFVAWSILDFIIHGLILQSTYEATAELWRPMAEMKMAGMYVVTAVAALSFTGVYCVLVRPKSLAAGVIYGVLFGIATGVSMGFGTYCVMPLPLHLAVAWFLGSLVEATAAGAIVGAVIRPGENTSGTSP